MRDYLLLSLVALVLSARVSSVHAQTTQPTVPASWQPIAFLLGDWTAEPDASGATGAFSFRLELNDRIVERRSFADYGAASGRPRHEDRMILYPPAAAGQPIRAIYFDTEGHVIHYTVSTSPDKAVLESDASEPGPAFRLSYVRLDADHLNGTFEIRAPGKPDFQTYLKWVSARTPGK